MIIGWDSISVQSDAKMYYFLWICFIIAICATLPVFALVMSHSFKINRNITTNELLNCKKYPEGNSKRYNLFLFLFLFYLWFIYFHFILFFFLKKFEQ